jgi:hypothetical protein
MKGLLTKMSIVASAVLLMGASGCKENKFVDQWSIYTTSGAFSVVASFNPDYELSLEGEIPFKDYGVVRFANNTSGAFTVEINMNYRTFGDDTFQRTTTLPTGTKFPSIVTGPMNMVQLLNKPNQYKIIGYFADVDDIFNAESVLVGVAIQLQGVKNNLPTGAITQKYFVDNRVAASFTIYGPQTDAEGTVLVPGGIFLAGDLKALQGTIRTEKGLIMEERSGAMKNASDEQVREFINSAMEEAERAGVLKKK